MKKNLIKLGVMLAATFSLTNCTEEITAPTPDVEKGPYTIYANAPETKTVNDGLSTNWAEGDALNVSHAPTGTLGLSYNTMFTLTDAETGRFDTEYLEGELVVSNDWYALYPYNEKIEYLNKMAEAGVYFTLASQVGYTQTQKGNDNMKHIAGENYPMYGVVRESLSEEFPSFMMSHVSSLIEVKVTNNVDDEIVVSSVSFTATEDVVGTYYIDITGDEPAFTGSGSSYVSRVANLAVEDGEPILMGESASFYLAVKPFTAPAGSELTIDVNGTKKTIALDYDVTFAEGKIKTINFDLNKYPELPESGPVESYLKWTTSSSAYSEKADINGGEEEVDVLKLGTSSKSGFATIAVPAGTTKIGFYAVSWKDQPATLAIKDANSVIATVAPQANEGASSNSPYTIVADEEADYYEIELNAAADTEYTLFTAGKNKRVIIWGLNCYDEKGIVMPEPEPEPEPEGPVEATVAEFSAAEDGDTVYELSGTITKIYQAYNENFNNISFYIEDSTGEVLIFRMSCEGIEDPTAISVGDEITVQGTKTTYNEAPQMAQGGKCINFEDTAKPEPEPEPELPSEPADLADGEYWIIANNWVAAPLTTNYGYLDVVPSIDGRSTAANAFTFTSVGDGLYTIQDSYGKYLYMTGTYNSFNVSAEFVDDSGYYWTLATDGESYVIRNTYNDKFVQYSEQHTSYGVYPDARGVLPNLVLADNPITEPEEPENPDQGEVEGTQVVFDWSKLATVTNTSYTGETVDGIELTGFNIATNKAGQFRVYAPSSKGNAYFTLNAGDKTITKVELTFTDATYIGPLEADGYADGKWTGSANEVTFTNTGSKQARITKIVVTVAD